jgi:hypothetical protein
MKLPEGSRLQPLGVNARGEPEASARGQKAEGSRGAQVFDCLLLTASCLLFLAVGIWIGVGVGRVDAVRAESPASAIVVATKNQSWNGIYGCPRPPRDDLRLLKTAGR